ncbi:hypothetical protein BKA83DRAFT_4058745, partial [Pisolithus microcarpus]
NYREVDWEKFNQRLNAELDTIGPPRVLASKEEFQRAARNVDLALQRTIDSEVPRTCPNPHRKHWWNRDLTKMRNDLKMLSKTSYAFRALPDHTSHRL